MKILSNIPITELPISMEKYDLNITSIDKADSNEAYYKSVMSDYDIWIEEDPKRITKEVIEAGINLKWIHVGRVGYDGAHLHTIRKKGIILTNSKGCNNIFIAEDVILKMLMLSRNSYQYFKQQQQKKWQAYRKKPLTGNIKEDLRIFGESTFSLFNKTIGILGTGAIGMEIAKRTKAFDMKVYGYNKSGRSVPNFDFIMNGDMLYPMLKKCDYVVCAFPLNKDTLDLCNMRFFKSMKESSYFINVSRGEVVNEDDLEEALNSEIIRGAAIDVASLEPLPNASKLWDTKNLIVTPHQAWISEHTFQKIKDIIIENIKYYPDKRKMINVIE
ncbi:NAD(P)-dependent oxidoreductase [Clostridium sp. DL1XJH146]